MASTAQAQAIEVVARSTDCVVTVATPAATTDYVVLRELGGEAALVLSLDRGRPPIVSAQPLSLQSTADTCVVRVTSVGEASISRAATEARSWELAAAGALAEARKTGAVASQQAAASYARAAAAWRAAGDPHRAARADVGAALVRLTRLEQYPQAFDAASRAYESLPATGADQLRAVAARVAAVGAANNTVRSVQDRRLLASQWFTRAFKHIREKGLQIEAAYALNEFGLAHYSWGDYVAATHWLDSALRVAKRHNVPAVMTLAGHNVAYIRGERGEYAQALERFQEFRRQISAQNDPGRYADVTANIARFAATLGLYDRALTEYRVAREMHARSNTVEGVATSEHGIALAYLSLGDTDSAISHLTAALALRELATDGPTARALYEALGTAYLQRDALADARTAFEKAWGLQLTDGERIDRALAMARLANASGQPREALTTIRTVMSLAARAPLTTRAALATEQARAARALRDTAGSIDPLMALRADLEQHSVGSLQTLVLSELAQSLLLAKKYLAAAEMADAAINVMERTRDAVAAPSIRAEYAAARRAVYDTRVAALLLGPRDEWSALLAADRPRARMLTHQGDAAATIYTDLDSRLLRLEELRAARSSNASLIADLEAQIRALRLKLALAADVKASRRTEAMPAWSSATALQRMIPRDTTLVFVSLEPERGFVWTITRDSLRSRQIPGDSVIAPLVTRLHRFAAQAEPLASEGALTRQLGQWLLEDAFDARRPSRILLCLDGSLHYVPLAALRLPGSEPGAPPRLVDVVSVAVAGSLRSLMTDSPPSRATSALLIQSDGARGTHRSLKGAQREVADISATLAKIPHRTLLNSVATVPAVREALSERIGWIHIASHGVANATIPELSALELTPLAQSNLPDTSGKLFAGEIRSLGIDAELVVLSGCETQFGRHLNGEGLQGLSYAFLTAGADRAVGSLWRVSDEATAELMTAFYRALSRSGDPAAALRDAQLALKVTRPHPYFWSGFVLTTKSMY